MHSSPVRGGALLALASLLALAPSRGLAQPPAADPVPMPEPAEEEDGAPSLRFSGFIQGQYVWNMASGDGVDGMGRPENQDRFEVRRARLKLTLDHEYAQAVLHIDALPSGFRLLEAEATARIPWPGGYRTDVTIGQMRMPFGWELQESMSRHPFPERSLWANRLFPGVRDLGARVQGTLLPEDRLRYQVALMNGNPIGDASFPTLDPNGFKDVIARVGFRAGVLTVGASGLLGLGYLPPAEDDPDTAEIDETHDDIDYFRWAAGLDAVVGVDIPVLGRLTLLGEVVLSENLDRASASRLPPVILVSGGPGQMASGEVTDRNQLGWYAGFLQELGTDIVAAGVRVQQFDPDLDRSNDTLTYATFVLQVRPVDPLRFTLAYELRREEPEVDDDQLWLRAQVVY